MPDLWACYYRPHGQEPGRPVIRGVALRLAKSTARADLLATGGDSRGDWALFGTTWILETGTGTYLIERADTPGARDSS